MDAKLRNIGRTALLVAVAALIPAVAMAQPGDGLRSGNFQLSPGVLFGVGYDSNVFYQSSDEQVRIYRAPTLLVEPRLRLSTIEANMVDLSFNGAVGWTQFLSDEDAVTNQSGLSTSLTGGIVLNPRGALSLRLSDHFVRTNEPPNGPAEQTLNRIWNRVGATVGIHPGGRILQSYLGYEWSIFRHNMFQDLDRDVHHFTWRNNWRFLPRTSLVVDADYQMVSYAQPFQSGSRGEVTSGRLANVDSQPLRLMGGVQGLLTNRLNVRALAGYGWGFYDDGPSFGGIIGTAELSYTYGSQADNNRIRLGYERNFADSPIGNYFQFHRVFAGFDQGFYSNRIRFALEGDVRVRDYELAAESRIIETPDRTYELPEDISDLLLGGRATLDYRVLNWWSVGLSYRLVTNMTEDVIEIDVPGEFALRDYVRHHAMITTTLNF